MANRMNQTMESQQKNNAVDTADHYIISTDRTPLPPPSPSLIALQRTQHERKQNHAHIDHDEVTKEPDRGTSQFSLKFLANMQRETQIKPSQSMILAHLQRQTQRQHQADMQSVELYGNSPSVQVEWAEQGQRQEHVYQAQATAQQYQATQGQNPTHRINYLRDAPS